MSLIDNLTGNPAYQTVAKPVLTSIISWTFNWGWKKVKEDKNKNGIPDILEGIDKFWREVLLDVLPGVKKNVCDTQVAKGNIAVEDVPAVEDKITELLSRVKTEEVAADVQA